MREDPEPLELHSGESLKDHKADAHPSTGGAARQAVVDTDQTAADTDQTLADADQTVSDADQSSSERDQAQADADQMASDRDQHASDRDQALQELTDPSAEEAAESANASKVERELSTDERKDATEERSLTLLERIEDAARRDEQAAVRDAQAAIRDRAAELRDRAGEHNQRISGPGGTYPTAAEDRARAAEDRARAAEDRKRAALDREQARLALEKAQLDDLTGCYRLGLGRAMLQREIDRSRRSGGRLALAYCDVDGLKRVNDEQGHAAGDALLKGVSEAIRSRLRSYDAVIRVGGDEFVCVLSEVDLEQASRIFNDIHDILAKEQHGASVSVGLATLHDDDSLATLMERGDRALRKARLASPSARSLR